MTIPETSSRNLYRSIVVAGQYVGFHKYEEAPEKVAFLKHSHRHLFKWDAEIQVFHDDRELEFFTVHSDLETKVLPFIVLTGNLGSCELQAERLLEGLIELYGSHRWYQVTVSEDGENAGRVSWNPDS